MRCASTCSRARPAATRPLDFPIVGAAASRPASTSRATRPWLDSSTGQRLFERFRGSSARRATRLADGRRADLRRAAPRPQRPHRRASLRQPAARAMSGLAAPGLRGGRAVRAVRSRAHRVGRILTHPRCSPRPTRANRPSPSCAHCSATRTRCCSIPGATTCGFSRSCASAADAGGDLVTDAYLAALALETGAELVSADRDFVRFPGLRWRRPSGRDPRARRRAARISPRGAPLPVHPDGPAASAPAAGARRPLRRAAENHGIASAGSNATCIPVM